MVPRIHSSIRVAGWLLAVLTASVPAQAQGVDTFNPAPNNYVLALAVQEDGKILVGGDFTLFGCFGNCGPGSVGRDRIARLNADGSLDPTFTPSVDGRVSAIVVQPDGKIVIAGSFAVVGGIARKYLARLNSDGSVDPVFNPGVNMNNPAYAMALQADGKIVVGGGFYGGLGGLARYYFGRLNADGTADASFETWTNGPVQAIAMQADGKILIGGLFTSIGGETPDTTRNYIGRINDDGTLDLSFNPGADQRVDVIAVQADGKILVGGNFTGLGGGTGTTPRFHIGRVEANGLVDQNFLPGADATIYSLVSQADGRILVGGNFTTLGGGGTGVFPRSRLGRLNQDGTIDTSLDPGAESTVYAIALQPANGHVLVAGTFDELGTAPAVARPYIGRILNTEPVVQSVTVDDGGATVTWLRNGTLPEVAFTDFAMSTDGVNYTPLGGGTGAGTRIVGGWRISGVSLPVHPQLTLRMRAHAPGAMAGASGSAIEWIVPAADFNVVQNGNFTFGLSGWLFFATPDMTYIQHNVTNGVLNAYRVTPPPGTDNQAVAFQQTGVSLSSGVPLLAEFDLGNSNNVRKRVSVLLHDSDFSDLSVCTFWLPANTPLTRYSMATHTTKPWLNLTISFYLASAGSDGGVYLFDNVSVKYSPGGAIDETLCDDLLTPGPGVGPDGPNVLVNGDFASGAVTPGWILFGQIDSTVTAGVFEFVRLNASPSGVILQQTGVAAAPSEILTATFRLGNTGVRRERVTVILHDSGFQDLSACTFWLEPGQPLSDYTYRTFTTQAWSNVTFSVYPSTSGTVRATQLDNVVLRRTPAAIIGGTECLEPGSSTINVSTAMAMPASRARRQIADAAKARRAGTGASISQSAKASLAPAPVAPTPNDWIDLSSAAAGATLHLESWLTATGARAVVQVSLDGLTWIAAGVVDESDRWTPVAIDLDPYRGLQIRIRFVLEPVDPATGGADEIWRIRAVRLERGRTP